MDNSVSCGEGERERQSDPLIKMNEISEPRKRTVGSCQDLNHVCFMFLFFRPLCNKKKLFYFFLETSSTKIHSKAVLCALASEVK